MLAWKAAQAASSFASQQTFSILAFVTGPLRRKRDPSKSGAEWDEVARNRLSTSAARILSAGIAPDSRLCKPTGSEIESAQSITNPYSKFAGIKVKSAFLLSQSDDSQQLHSNLPVQKLFEKLGMSVRELEARVDEMSADTEMKKQLRVVKQRQLNSLRDPLAVSRLPLEISSEIFLQCLPEHSPWLPQRPTPRSAPMLLMSICNTWSDIALSTSALWSTIHLETPTAEILRLWLQRARDHACSVTLRRALDPAVANFLTEYGVKLKHLEIHDEDPVGSLALAARGSFPGLETLTICTLMNRDGEEYTHLNDVIQLLRLTPNLVECTLNTLYTYDDTGAPTILVLPLLTCMNFAQTVTAAPPWIDSSDNILVHLSLPALQTLFIAFNCISSADFLLFLERSSPPLQKLVIGVVHAIELPFPELDRYLRLLPSLTSLELYTTGKTVANDLFCALADSPSPFLPNLQHLKIYQKTTDPSHQALLPAPIRHSFQRSLLAARASLPLYSGLHIRFPIPPLMRMSLLL
ncbi:hypothetical protein B0H16DRAFT_1697804 [Mycena metata]|uniref:F-box domain-containing protein n=1 Tax=Mycena metata TaxID=1033252 RepID=A0AAD7HSK7_9AGAR|nr:hypothetical protein B0H16DRAFT_1697804 [Mycena metata]